MDPGTPPTKAKKNYNKPLTEEQKARARARWQENKEKYRKSTKNPDSIQPTLKPDELPPLPKKDKKRANFLESWPIPTDLQQYFGGDSEIRLSKDQQTWPMFHVRRQKDLSEITKKNYKQYYARIPRGDIFAAVRFIVAQPLHTRAQFAKAGLSYVSEELYNSLYVNKDHAGAASKEYKDNLLRMMVFSLLNQNFKKEVFTSYAQQAASQDRHENTVPWDEWEMVARRFVKTIMTKKDPSAKDKKDALMVALYSFIPPIRLDWKDVEVRVVKGGKTFESNKGEEGKNILYLSATKSPKTVPSALMFWGSFKNSNAFELPLKQSLPKDLIKVIKFAAPTDSFTAGQTYTLVVDPHFSSYLSSLAEQITGKHFTNRLMRSSYIKNYHQKNTNGEIDIGKTKEVMKLMHQTNMEIHFGYVKNKTVGLTEENDT
jgi:hypothetical protein